ncbi:hypothetical protein [Spirosoma fluviale]|uniref:Neutral/alkaline non-lysosomal ceramidase, N-terminal n=1 Tax=Spirosoma fluviale TaxID=1597977 RepID=A0A286G5P4_9BACT|nr:hypothetical protein [Spirosoma fluviale]SOD90792.1 hypothetical protein SAMN06269250_3541 [Spirosoma fluviale]
MRRYRITIFVVALVIINILGLSFTVVNKGSYKNSLYYRFTRQRFAWIVSDPRPKEAIRAGWASITIKPETSAVNAASPRPKWDSVQTRALVLDNGTTRAVMITVDLPMMPPTVAQALEQKLPRLGFAWKNVYLGATDSQPDLSGWASDYMGQREFGPYDEQRANQLTEAILKAVTLAQKNSTTVQIGYTQVDLKIQQQLSAASGRAGADPLHLLQLRKLTGESALIYSGSVNQISSENTTNSTDDPHFFRLLTQQLNKQTRWFAMPVAGPVEDADYSGQVKDKSQQVASLVDQITTLLASQPLRTDSTLIAQTAPLIQNDPQIRVSQSFRLKPWLAKALYGDYPAELKALRIGQTVFVGCPGGVSNELAGELRELPIADNRNLVITSYNGGNLGQIVPDKHYYAENSPYVIGQINRFGPHTAEFFADMTQSLVSSLK